MLSKKSKYALKAMMVLAKEYGQGPVLISDLAQREGIPRKFLELILLELKNQGLLQARRARAGDTFSDASLVRSAWGTLYACWTDQSHLCHASARRHTCDAASAAMSAVAGSD